MDKGLTSLNEKFEEVKEMLTLRAATVLGEAILKIFLDVLDEYHGELVRTLEIYDKQREGTKEENTMLLGLVGANDPEFRAKLISQGEEIRFLRQEVFSLKTERGELVKKNDALSIEVARLKNELGQSFKMRDKDQKDLSEQMESVSAKLKLYEELINSKQIEIGLKGKELDSRLGTISEDVRDRSAESVKKAVFRLNNIIHEVKDMSRAVNNEIEAERAAIEQERKKGQGIFGGKPGSGPIFLSLIQTYDLMNERVGEAAVLLSKYMEVLSPPEITPAKVNWKKLFDDLKIKFSPQAGSKRIKINVPKDKMPSDFISDQSQLLKAFSSLVQNSIESLPVDGVIEIKISFTSLSAEISVCDNGKPIDEGQRDMLFMPLYTTKSSHYGMGLADCRRILKALGGNIIYNVYDGGNCFKIALAPVKLAEKPKGVQNAH
jgi:signal transduction histidine kinase